MCLAALRIIGVASALFNGPIDGFFVVFIAFMAVIAFIDFMACSSTSEKAAAPFRDPDLDRTIAEKLPGSKPTQEKLYKQ
jgi:hypothetical protein